MTIDDTEADTLRPEYDFAALGPGVRGKHHEKAKRQLRVVQLDNRLAEAFPDEQSVRVALETYLAEHPEQTSANG